MKQILRILFAWLFLAISLSPAFAANRVALVIGNSAYQAAPPLANPVNDATAVGTALKGLGFEVILGLDQSGSALRELVRQFSEKSEGAELALFFYAGHGIQVSGKNYLIPVDAVLDREADLDFAAVELPLVLRQMEQSAKNSVILLDACRDNPFETRLTRAMGSSRSAAVLSRGLAPVETVGGALIGFATDPGEVAFDGNGRHSPFTEALLNHIETPGLEVNTLMTRVRAEVVNATERRQRPWATSSLLDELYLAPLAEPEPDLKPEPDPVLEDVAAWRAANADGSEAALQDYLTRFPKGLFGTEAARKLAALPDLSLDLAAIDALRARPLEAEPEATAPDDCPDCPDLVAIPGGQFQMGSNTGGSEERPVIDVQIAPFTMSRGEITVSEFRRFVQASGYAPPEECFVWTDAGKMRNRPADWRAPGFSVADDMPAACVNWNDAKSYADWLSGVTGKTVRLPSEAELEYVIRAGSDGEYPFAGGAQGACRLVNAADASSRFAWKNATCTDGFSELATSAELTPNAFGLTATSGNLWEWAGDCWNGSHKGASSTGSTRSSGQCASRVLRGGSWDDPLENLRAAYRVGIPANRRQANVGFRIVIEP